MSADLTWAVTFLAAGTMWVVIAALYCRRDHRRRRHEPTWWERDIRYRQLDREQIDSEPHIWNH